MIFTVLIHRNQKNESNLNHKNECHKIRKVRFEFENKKREKEKERKLIVRLFHRT